MKGLKATVRTGSICKYSQSVSELLDITYGFPQGSILGPWLFVFYFNNICIVS